MDVMRAIEQRREITAFQEKEIPRDVMEQLIRAVYLAPSGNNTPSREMIVVQNRQMLAELSETTPYMAWLKQATAGIVIVGKEGASKYWLQDASIAGGYLWLAAASLGVGAAWGAVYHAEDAKESGRRENYVRTLLNIPDEVRVVAVIGLGYPAAEPEPKRMYPLETVLHREKYEG